jgi:hypothetical protein
MPFPTWSRVVAMLGALVLVTPGEAGAHPCEEEIAKGRQFLDYENRNLLLLELAGPNPTVQILRNNLNFRMMQFMQAQAQCAQAVRDEQQGGAPAATGCTRDVECKGDRICVSGACVNP